MSDLINFVNNNYEFIIAILSFISFIVSLIINIIKHTKLIDKDKVCKITCLIPAILQDAEEVFKDVKKSGALKLTYALNVIESMCAELGTKFDEDLYTNKIEGVLVAPQKK